jgi:hypothetical protein
MNAPIHPVQTAADVLAMLQQANFPPLRKRDLLSAVRRVCEMLGHTPALLKIDVPVLRKGLDDVRPAAHGISASTFSNLRSLFATALKWAGLIESIEPGAARRDPSWTPMVEAISGDKRLSNGLATFMNWCAQRRVIPGDVDDDAVQAFLDWLETRTLKPRSRQLVRETAKIWTEAQARVPGWPAKHVSPVSFRPVSTNLTWEELPATLREEAVGYLALRSKPDVFDADPAAPKRALASSTIRQQREHIRLAVSVLVRSGTPVEEMQGLANLVTVDAWDNAVTRLVLALSMTPSFAARSLPSASRWRSTISAALAPPSLPWKRQRKSGLFPASCSMPLPIPAIGITISPVAQQRAAVIPICLRQCGHGFGRGGDV